MARILKKFSLKSGLEVVLVDVGLGEYLFRVLNPETGKRIAGFDEVVDWNEDCFWGIVYNFYELIGGAGLYNKNGDELAIFSGAEKVEIISNDLARVVFPDGKYALVNVSGQVVEEGMLKKEHEYGDEEYEYFEYGDEYEEDEYEDENWA